MEQKTVLIGEEMKTIARFISEVLIAAVFGKI